MSWPVVLLEREDRNSIELFIANSFRDLSVLVIDETENSAVYCALYFLPFSNWAFFAPIAEKIAATEILIIRNIFPAEILFKHRVINRPGVYGSVLKTPWSFIH